MYITCRIIHVHCIYTHMVICMYLGHQITPVPVIYICNICCRTSDLHSTKQFNHCEWSSRQVGKSVLTSDFNTCTSTCTLHVYMCCSGVWSCGAWTPANPSLAFLTLPPSHLSSSPTSSWCLPPNLAVSNSGAWSSISLNALLSTTDSRDTATRTLWLTPKSTTMTLLLLHLLYSALWLSGS